MTEGQLKAFPAFKTLPVYDESDERADSITNGSGWKIRECTTVAGVQDCLKDPKLVPLGGLRVGQKVVAYFGERA